MAGEVVVDALPYIDQGYDEPGVREAASFRRSDFSAGAVPCLAAVVSTAPISIWHGILPSTVLNVHIVECACSDLTTFRCPADTLQYIIGNDIDSVSKRCCALYFKIGKAIIDKWNNILDRQVKYLKKPEDEKGTGFEAKSIKKYIYNDQLGFHLNFFKGILPSIQKLDENETKKFQVLNILQNIHQSRSTPLSASWSVHHQSCMQPSTNGPANLEIPTTTTTTTFINLWGNLVSLNSTPD
uniref:Uncharacterized protein n=1 Tax=Timema shepardi TaxID=629360 RepID=A0A7R9AX46_TIMSH|nr:unnamed protein product [Timema shepardi]